MKNSELIRRWSRYSTNLNQLIEETETLFQKVAVQPTPAMEEMRTIVSDDGEAVPSWLTKLDIEFEELQNEIKMERSIIEFGAIGDGVTDNTQAFRKAIGRGCCKVILPEGVFVTKGIKLPSNTYLVGAGKGKTILKLHPDAPKSAILVTNKHHISGNHHIYVEGMTLDWNAKRLPPQERTASGNNRSSCLTLAHVTYGWVRKVEAIHAGLHAFDVSSTLYYYIKDGFIGPGRSKYIWLDELNGYGFGDDGITTHHSDYIFISRSHMCDPSGRAHEQGFSNSNGIEIDDGSRYVWLSNNTTARCFGGVEIKAHHNASAASNVTIIGHLSVHDNRAYNFRHIGHHKGKDPDSKTAYNLRIMNVIAIAPVFTPLYEASTPRGMVISAYRNVVVNQFTLLGDPTYDFGGHPVIAVQFRANSVVLNKIYIEGFYHASGIKGHYNVLEDLI